MVDLQIQTWRSRRRISLRGSGGLDFNEVRLDTKRAGWGPTDASTVEDAGGVGVDDGQCRTM